MTTKLTKRRLEAMQCAVSAMLAGEEGEGDAEGVSFTDLELAEDWIAEQLFKRHRPIRRENNG